MTGGDTGAWWRSGSGLLRRLRAVGGHPGKEGPDDDAGGAASSGTPASSGTRSSRADSPFPPRLAPRADAGPEGASGAHVGRDGDLDAALRTLELTVRRRLDGLLQGNHLGLVPGPGSEAGDARPYQPGDDVRRMDWSVTARTSEPHIRETIADRELETWLVVDLSPSLDFGTGGCEKRDLAIAACAAVVHLVRGGGNRIGAIVTTGRDTVRLPARGGAAHAHALMRRIAATPRAPEGTRGDLVGAIETLRRPPRRRGLAVVVSDFLGDVDWDRSLRGLAARHEVLAIEVGDRRDEDLPDVGTVVLADPESGHVREVTTTPTLRRRFAAEAAAHSQRVATTLRAAGAGHLRLRTDRDWIADVVRFVVARKRGWSGQGGAGTTSTGTVLTPAATSPVAPLAPTSPVAPLAPGGA